MTDMLKQVYNNIITQLDDPHPIEAPPQLIIPTRWSNGQHGSSHIMDLTDDPSVTAPPQLTIPEQHESWETWPPMEYLGDMDTPCVEADNLKEDWGRNYWEEQTTKNTVHISSTAGENQTGHVNCDTSSDEPQRAPPMTAVKTDSHRTPPSWKAPTKRTNMGVNHPMANDPTFNEQNRPMAGGEDKWKKSAGFVKSSLASKLLEPMRDGQIRCLFFNVNTLTIPKCQDILFYYRTWHIDVLVLIDTRVTTKSMGMFKWLCEKEMAHYPLGWTPYFSPAKMSRKGNGCVGGQLWIVNNRLQDLQFNELVLNGAVVELTAKFGKKPVSIMGNYWPCKPRQISEGNSLWNQLRLIYLTPSPIEMIKEKISNRINQIKEDRTLILGGDFNSDVNFNDTYRIKDFAFLNELEMGNTEDLKQPSFARAGHSNRLDYIMTRGNCSTAMNNPVDLLEQSEDHSPIVSCIRIAGAGARPERKATILIRNIINRKDVRTIAGMEDFLLNNNIEDPDPGIYIDSFSKATAVAAGSSFIRGQKQKDGWSVIAQALHINLRMIIIIRRHIDGINRTDSRQWKSFNFIKGLKKVMKHWRSCINSLSKTDEDRMVLKDVSAYGYNYWLNAPWILILTSSNDAYRHVRSLLHGRRRKEYRMLQNNRMALIEKAREAKQIGRAIRALQEPSPKFNMAELRVGNDLVTNPYVIAESIMENFVAWFKAVINPLAGTPGSNGLDMDTMELNAEDFLMANQHTNIPIHLLLHLHKHLQPKKINKERQEEFAKAVMTPPSLEDFNEAIHRLPDRSAPGISGLNYDCIKLWDMDTRIKVLKALNQLWEEKKVPQSWLWKWLVPLPKCPNPQLTDLRPLVLIEALRKVWVGIFTFRINTFLVKNKVLCDNQHGFIWGKSVESASLVVLNALETACEWRTDLYISSWDIKRAFDSVPFRMLIWSLVRIGVPPQLAKYLVQMDVDGKMVVRTPLALDILKKKGVEGLQEAGMVFSAEKGTGQGDKLSPLVWDAFCDILLSALEDMNGGEFFTQDHTGENKKTPDVAYADDIVSQQGTMESLQHKADLISAFNIIMNMEIATGKLRVLGVKWGNAHRDNIEKLLIHTAGWIASEIDVKPDGELKHLGIVWSMDLSNNSNFEAARLKLQKWCINVKRSRLSAASKKVALETSIFQKIIYCGRFSPWTEEQLRILDKLVENLLRSIFKCSYGSPTSLFYIDKMHGGYGCKQLSEEINKARLAMMWRMLSTRGYTRHAILSCISRGFRAAGQNMNEPERVSMEPPLSDHWWISNVRNYLKSLEMDIVRNGSLQLYDKTNSWAGVNLNTEKRSILNRAGIYSFGECGGPEDLPLLTIDGLNISELGGSPASDPITLRTGQCWLINNQIWEILGFVEDKIDAINWKPKDNIELNSVVYLEGTNFSRGSGGGTLIDQSNFIARTDTHLVNLSPEVHLKDGTSTSRIIAIRPRTGKSRERTIGTTIRFSDITDRFPPMVRDIFTDGSWMQTGSVASRLMGSPYTRTNGAIVLELDNGWIPDYFGIKIIGSIHQTKSAYTMELLSILGGAYIANGLAIPGCVRSDCKAAISSCQKAWRGRPGIRKYPLLGHIAAMMPPWTIAHVKSHPERHKRNMEWTSQDCGIFVADCTAGEGASTTKAGIIDTDLLDELCRHLPFIILDLTGEHVLEDLADRRQRLRVRDYLKKRDEFRAADKDNPRPPKWAGMNTQLMSNMMGLKKTGVNSIARSIKAAFDWFFTGSNRRKGNPNADASCLLCGKYEDQKHILLSCPHAEQKFLRHGLLNDFRDSIVLESSTSVQAICRKLLNIIENEPSGYQLLLGLLDPQIRQTLKDQCDIQISGTEWNAIMNLLKTAGKSALGIILSHIKLSAIRASGKTPTHKFCRTTMGRQVSLDSYYETTEEIMDPATMEASSSSSSIEVMDTIKAHWPEANISDEDEAINLRPAKRARSAIYDDEDYKTTLIRGPGTWKRSGRLPLIKTNRSFAKDIRKRKRDT